jgi:serine/threonine-protein kinase
MTDVLERLTAALADRYRIGRELGAGGMATVYLAEDLKHDRKVALKVLKPELAAVLGADRFVQEIKTTASLQHPHILPLFDSGQADGFLYYVMPYVEGETLRDKLDRETQLGIDEAVQITTEVADALDYAHRNGVIHRDIKPENILLHDGRPMVADFGIALAVSAAAGGRMTETGLSLGTPHYMSPEQATAEKDLTNRSDIYSLAAVLYEMLSGDPPHVGASAQQIIMKIVTEEAVPVTSLRKSVPSNVAAAVGQGLAKLPADRFATAKEFEEALHNVAFAAAGTSASAAGQPIGAWNPIAKILAGLSMALSIAVVALVSRGDPTPPAEVTRFTVELTGERGTESGDFNGPGYAISDDGGRIAYLGAAGERSQILVRERDRLDAEVVRSTDDVRCCMTFSPDGQSLAYITMQLDVKVVSISGGLSHVVADSSVQDPSLYGGGVDWGPDDLVYFSTFDGIWRRPPGGGVRERVTAIRPGERTHAWMDVLPNGKGALITVIPSNSNDLSAYAIGVVDFGTGKITELFQGVYARYVPAGYVVFVRDDGTLVAAPFDQRRLEPTAPPVELVDDIEVGRNGAARMALSPSGTLLYRRGRQVIDRLAWVDRGGTPAMGVAPELDGRLQSPRLSPDGKRIALASITAEGMQLWTKSLGAAVPVRHTVSGQVNWRPNWSPAGDVLYFISDRDDLGAVFEKRVDGTGNPRRVSLPESRPIFEVLPVDDTTLLVRTDNNAPGNGDIFLAHLSADTTVTPIVATPAAELTPAVSENRRWLAYVSDETGRYEVYVRPFPNVTAGVFRISTSGGTEPVWAHSGRELFYRNAAGGLVSAEVTTVPSFGVSRQHVLFDAKRYRANIFDPQYAVAHDDQRFLMILRDVPETTAETVVVLNWFEELRKAVER